MDLWHYTDTAGLLGILKSKEVWSSDALYLNDRLELAHGRRAFRDALDAVSNEHTDFAAGGVAFKLAAFARELDEDQDPAFRSNLNAALVDARAFVTCFCSKGDILGQWRGYAGGSGFAIRFNERWARLAAGGTKGLGRGELVAVRYENSVDAAVSFGVMLRELVTRKPGFDTRDLFSIHARASEFKHPSFAEERESRLIFPNPAQSVIQVRERSGLLIPYSTISFETSDIAEVRIGPNVEIREQALRDALVATKFDLSSIKVSRSVVPYRA